MLLPWYVTGRLDRADAARVESYLARHPQIAAQLDLIRAEREETVMANEALGVAVGRCARSPDGLAAAGCAEPCAAHRQQRLVPGFA